jgi:hypothetical protein
MHMPKHILKTGNFDKAKNQRNNKRVFNDKIVNSKNSPLLFDIEVGRKAMSTIFDGAVNTRVKSTAASIDSDRGSIAREMLLQTNVTYEDTPKNFSLLTRQSNKPGLHNKNIMDTRQFEETVNQPITAEDKFTQKEDPFYNLDEGEMTNTVYTTEVDPQGRTRNVPDLSSIAAGLTRVNLSKNYKGKSKYFTKNSLKGKY